MTSWPSVQITAPADDAIIDLEQTYPTTIYCNIEQPGNARSLQLTNCAASADCLTLAAQTKWLFFTVNVSIELAMVDPTQATVTINADGQTIHQIAVADFVLAKAFIANCKLPAIPPSFSVGLVKP